MSAETIFRVVGKKTGQNPSDATERLMIADLVNAAARALYDEVEIPFFVKEATFTATPDAVLVLPTYVGHIRAMRQTDTRVPYTLRDLFSRYQHGTLTQALWFSWTVLGHRALNVSSLPAGALTLTIAIAEPSISVTVVGPTATAARAVQTLVMDATSKSVTTAFTRIDEIFKSAQSTGNINLVSGGTTTIATIPNHHLKSEYLHVDVSQYPSNTVSGLSMDVLYKETLPYMYADDDEFADGTWDDVLINKCIGLWCEDNALPEEAILRDRKATREAARKLQNINRGIVQVAKFSPHPHDTLVDRSVMYRRNLRRVV